MGIHNHYSLFACSRNSNSQISPSLGHSRVPKLSSSLGGAEWFSQHWPRFFLTPNHAANQNKPNKIDKGSSISGNMAGKPVRPITSVARMLMNEKPKAQLRSVQSWIEAKYQTPISVQYNHSAPAGTGISPVVTRSRQTPNRRVATTKATTAKVLIRPRGILIWLVPFVSVR